MAKLTKQVFKVDPAVIKRVDALLKTPEARQNSLCRSDVYRFALVEYLAAREKPSAPAVPKASAAPKSPKPASAPKPYAPASGAKVGG